MKSCEENCILKSSSMMETSELGSEEIYPRMMQTEFTSC